MAIDVEKAFDDLRTGVEEMVKEHLENNPYRVECGHCGKQLEFASELDKDLDLIVTVYKCDCSE